MFKVRDPTPDEQNVTYTYKSSLFSFKKKEILSHATARMNLKDNAE